jgi:uncharacterized integral membrane protein (TIGR00698 family)
VGRPGIGIFRGTDDPELTVITRVHLQTVLFFLCGALCLTGWLSPPLALGLGIVLALTAGHPFPSGTPTVTKFLLQASVVGLGFGINLSQVWQAGRTGFGFTAATIIGTLAAGWLIGRLLKVERGVSLLISSGTAICGGSAIAAVGSVIKADKKSMSVALGAVFLLNAAALFLFPPIGRALDLSQTQFGLWAAIAIHDTSSVVGAAARYGADALDVATTVKLTRALWIIPLTLAIALASRSEQKRVVIPWFIFLFVAAAAVRTALPGGEAVYGAIKALAVRGLTLTLFLIGTGLTLESVRTVGGRALIQAVILWLLSAGISLLAVRSLMGL